MEALEPDGVSGVGFVDVVVGAVLRSEGAVRGLQVGGDVEVAPSVFCAEGLHACVQRIDVCVGELALF